MNNRWVKLFVRIVGAMGKFFEGEVVIIYLFFTYPIGTSCIYTNMSSFVG
jgi:hypothetical protein